MECKNVYDEFLFNKDVTKLSDCYYQNFKTPPLVVNAPNPVNQDETCVLVSRKRIEYYIHDYNPGILKKIDEYNIDQKKRDDLKKHINDVFDLTPRQRCCNCISISLYNVTPSGIYKYLYSIRRTIKNVKKCLPDWIVRLYIDSSVYEAMKNDSGPYADADRKEINTLLNSFFEEPNLEIYTYFCPDILNKKVKLARTRTFRFMPMIEDDVNVCVVREADGIVTNLDCHNIKMFAGSDRIFYFVPFSAGYNHIRKQGKNLFFSYSPWLTFYKEMIDGEFFGQNNNMYDLLAGTFAVKLKVKREAYYIINAYVRESSDRVSAEIEENVKSNIKTKSIVPKRLIAVELDEKTYDIYNTLTIRDELANGYDEIFLLCLFKNIISSPIRQVQSNGETMYEFSDLHDLGLKNSLIFADDDIRIINFQYVGDQIDIEATLNNLVKIGYIAALPIMDFTLVNNSISEGAGRLTLFGIDDANIPDYIRLAKIYFIDSFMVPDNILTRDMFNVRSNDDADLLSQLNKPFGGSIFLDYQGRRERFANRYYDGKMGQVEPVKMVGGSGTNYYKKYLKYKKKYLLRR